MADCCNTVVTVQREYKHSLAIATEIYLTIAHNCLTADNCLTGEDAGGIDLEAFADLVSDIDFITGEIITPAARPSTEDAAKKGEASSGGEPNTSPL